MDWEKKEDVLKEVREDGLALQFASIKDADVCLAAVQENGRALVFVPEELKTMELCLAAMNETKKALAFVPEEMEEAVLALAVCKDENDEYDLLIETQDEMIMRYLLSKASEFGGALARNYHCPVSILDELSDAKVYSDTIRLFVVKNIRCPEDVVKKLMHDESEKVRRAAKIRYKGMLGKSRYQVWSVSKIGYSVRFVFAAIMCASAIIIWNVLKIQTPCSFCGFILQVIGLAGFSWLFGIFVQLYYCIDEAYVLGIFKEHVGIVKEK